MFCCVTETPQFWGDICDEIRLFFDNKRIEKNVPEGQGDVKVLRHFFTVADGEWHSRAEYYDNGVLLAAAQKEAAIPMQADALTVKKLQKRLVKQNVYELLSRYTGEKPPWGSLTGIRPTKLLRELQDTHGNEQGREMFGKTFDVSQEKTLLANEIVQHQQLFIEDVQANDVDIYVGIPFCVSRCKYCSFISRDVQRSLQLKDAYLKALQQEMELLRHTLEQYNVRAVYVGGGTPTALDVQELDLVLKYIVDNFGRGMEFTVEAGRPDTVTEEKLQIIQKYGAKRISINTQTTKNETLQLIGRQHSAQDFYDAFRLVRQFDFDTVNTDIIVGLPGESVDDVQRTLETVCTLAPENVTVHTLAIKNASEFALEQAGHLCGRETVEQALEFAHIYLHETGYLPYYLYRQKYMNGSMENTGYAKPGHIGIYNIDNMEETVSVLAFGAGGISKRLFNAGARIERAANVKDLEHYVNRVVEMAQRKQALFKEPLMKSVVT